MRSRFFAVLFVVIVLVSSGCSQQEKAPVSEKEQISSVEFFDTENLFLLERIEHSFVSDGEDDNVELYTSAQVAPDGQMGWDSGEQWALIVENENMTFVLYDEYVQYGEVQFWVSDLNPDEISSPEAEDLEEHIYVMVTNVVGLTLYDYVWDAENSCFWKSTAFNPDNQWNIKHSNKYSFPVYLGTEQ